MIDDIIDYENGELDNAGVLRLFSTLIRTGAALSLQGSYHRTARDMIANGYLTESGDLTLKSRKIVEVSE